MKTKTLLATLALVLSASFAQAAELASPEAESASVSKIPADLRIAAVNNLKDLQLNATNPAAKRTVATAISTLEKIVKIGEANYGSFGYIDQVAFSIAKENLALVKATNSGAFTKAAADIYLAIFN